MNLPVLSLSHHTALAITLILGGAANCALAQQRGAPLTWSPAARMETGRVDHCAVALDGGRVFVAGGTGPNGALNSAEIYGPEDEFTAAPPMSMARSGHTCTLLADGRILVAGGAAATDANGAEAEIFSVLTNEWIPARGDAQPRRGATATLLPEGSVVIAGGTLGGEPTDLIEIFHPDTGTVTPSAARLTERRAQHAAALLGDGRVLVTGGTDGRQSLQSAEIFDPATETVAAAAPLGVARAGHGVAVLEDGRVLIAGGNDGSADLDSAEVYHPDSNRMEMLVSGMWVRVRDPFLTVIPGTGQVLIAGGETAGSAVAITQVFEPATNRFFQAGSLTAARTRITGAALDDGLILATGGRNAAGPSAACGIFTLGPTITLGPATGGELVQLSLGAPDFQPDQLIRVSGRGFAPDVNVTFALRRADGTTANDRLLVLSARSSATGLFQADFFKATSGDVGSSFILRVSPAASGIPDGTSNTIIVGESAPGPEAGFDVKVRLSMTLSPQVSRVLVGRPLPITLATSAATNAGGVTGNASVSLQAAQVTVPMNTLPPGSKYEVSLCCIDTPGTYSASVSYPGDPRYSAARGFSPSFTVVSNQVTLSLSALSFPLFTDTEPAVQVRAASSGVPAPTGQVKVTHTTSLKPEVFTLDLARDLRSPMPGAVARFPFKATFLDKPVSCFTLVYTGDANYPGATASLCIPTTPAEPRLEISAPSDLYTFGTPFPVDIKLSFPPELGLVARTVRLVPPNSDFKLAVAVGSAALSANLNLAFGERAIEATYAGGGDVGPARALFSVRMRPAATTTTLDPLPATSVNPVTLRAVIRSVLPVGTTPTGTHPVPTGTVQFFDGGVILGQVQATANADGTASATLGKISRPVGARSFRAVYTGNSQFASSTSPVLTVTIQ